MFDRGSGPPVIVVPGIQGRWEWMRPALRALQARCRTISYTLAGDLGSDAPFQAGLGFEHYERQLDAVFERTGSDRVALCGVSYGGLIAVRYAASRPERVSALVLVSSPAPGWVPNPRQRKYAARPWLSTPAFVLTAPGRLWPEIRAARPTWPSRLGFAVAHTWRVLSAPVIPSVMAARVGVQAMDFVDDCARVVAPTLVVTGEPHLDLVVPVEITRSYVELIPGARYEMMTGTGHLGLMTQPMRFAHIVSEFVHANHH